MIDIINRAKAFTYNSLEYIDIEELADAKALFDTEEYIILYKIKKDKLQIYWAAASKAALLMTLGDAVNKVRLTMADIKDVLIGFIPEDFLRDVEALGFKIVDEWSDFWIDDLSMVDIKTAEYNGIRYLYKNEYSIAAQITKDNIGYSRGFVGETDQWMKEWNEAENSCVLAAERNGEIAGVCCLRLYGFDSEKGTVMWLREIAVKPQYHGQGIGRSLVSKAIEWGKRSGAKRSFLACDIENYNAIKLYESLGYVRAEGRGEINLGFRLRD